ncbi:type I-E CRISPR-associated protein Cas5/CasD [Salisaeta longa]|uniref:type I-E CRISPR-associated protein Cas5/CasD n=1 Tax=Salisaeta longa TaxID=503170 RepID=UPI0003B77F91|nr:type I-E CRISPR-associated protein Cas5/CasD [Salisaeta longa]
MTYSILRFDAPMMSFGAPIVSEEGLIQPFPALSMMTGMLANALGYDRREPEKHERLQRGLSYAVREDMPGEKIVDYQTADLGHPHLQAKSKGGSVAWTTWGTLDQRGSGNTATTNIRNREYWAGAVYTVALNVQHLAAEQIEAALRKPERPLFIGRQPCLPGVRMYQGTVEAERPQEALADEETFATDEEGTRLMPKRLWYACDADTSGNVMPVTDARDWTNQIHVGERFICEKAMPKRWLTAIDALSQRST